MNFASSIRTALIPIPLLLLVACATTSPGPSTTSNSNDWRQLFAGRTMDGWSMVKPGYFDVEDGELVTHGGMGMLWFTREKFSNCQIKVVYKPTGPDQNSGVFIRIPEPPSDAWYAVNHGYEVQIENRGDDYHHTGCLYSLTKAINRVDSKINEWNTMLITLDGLRTRVEVNGLLVTDYTEGMPVPPKNMWYEPGRRPRPMAGYIGLQNHDDTGHVHFKEVSVRSLSK